MNLIFYGTVLKVKTRMMHEDEAMNVIRQVYTKCIRCLIISSILSKVVTMVN